MQREVLRSEDVVLLLGFWQRQAEGWRRIGGHYVTVAGVGRQGAAIAFSAPYLDNAEAGGRGRVMPGPHGAPHIATVHNDAQFASHDLYHVQETDSPGGVWGPVDYPLDREMLQTFAGQNVPIGFEQYTGEWQPGLPVLVEV